MYVSSLEKTISLSLSLSLSDDKRWSSSRTLVVPRSCKEPILDINPGLRDVSSGVDTADRLLNNSMPMSALSGRGEGDAPQHAWTKSKDSHMG